MERSAVSLPVPVGWRARRTNRLERLVHAILKRLSDFRHAVRSLRRRPHAAIAAILVAGVGIGCAISVLAFAYRVYLEPLPFADASRVVNIFRSTNLDARGPMSVPEFEDLVERQRAFEHVALVQNGSLIFQSDDANPIQVPGTHASWTLLRVLGLDVARGRDLAETDDRPEAERVALISQSFWETHFAGADNALGATLRIDDRPTTVVGILPPGLERAAVVDHVPLGDIWMPRSLTFNRTTNAERAERFGTYALGRIHAQTSLEAADGDVGRIGDQLATEHSQTSRSSTFVAASIRDTLMRDVEPYLRALIAVSVLILIATIVNLGNLSLANTLVRRRELATRQALGAQRITVAGHVLTESAIIGIAGALLGVLVAGATASLIANLMPSVVAEGFDARNTLVMAALVPLVAGMVIAMSIPSILFVTGPRALRMVGATRDNSESRGGRSLRGWMVVAEVVIAVVLLIGAGLLTASLAAMRGVDPGFRAARLTEVNLRFDPDADRTLAEQVTFYTSLLDDVRSIPGVDGAALSSLRVLDPVQRAESRLTVVDGPIPALADMQSTTYMSVSPDYFEVMGVELRHGRAFDAITDQIGNEPLVAIINESIVRDLWPGHDLDATTKRVGFELIGSPERFTVQPRTVVGVVEDAKYGDLTDPAANTVYVPLTQPPNYLGDASWTELSLSVRGTMATEPLMEAVRDIVRDAAPGTALHGQRTMPQAIENATTPQRNLGRLVQALAILAVILAAVGIYGVTATSVVTERRDIGVRAALGADPAHLMRTYLKRAVVLVAIGVSIGLGAALFIMPKIMGSVLYGIGARTPLPYLASVAVLGVIAVAAALLPALRAARVPPTEVLRDVS